MSSIITNKGLELFAKLQVEHKHLLINKFIYAYIPGLDPEKEVDPNEGMPTPEQIVYESTDIKDGYANEHTVVYSNLLGSEIGDFEFNWIGLYCSEHETLCMIYHQYSQKKWKTHETIIGNVILKNIGVQYVNIKDLANITIKAETWQIDLSERLKGMDNREQASNHDLYGEKYFFLEEKDAFLIHKTGEKYYANPGIGYVMGIQIENKEDSDIGYVGALPKKIYLDVWLEGDYSGVEAKYEFIISAEEVHDYTDIAGQYHYVRIIASVAADGVITDLRAGTNGKIPELEKNAIKLSDNPELNDSKTGASTVATKILADRIKRSGTAVEYRVGDNEKWKTIHEALEDIDKAVWATNTYPYIKLVDKEIYEIDKTIELKVPGMILEGITSNTKLESIDKVEGTPGKYVITATLEDTSELFIGSVINITPTGTELYKNFGSCYVILSITGNVVTLSCKCNNSSVGDPKDVTGGNVIKYLSPICNTGNTNSIKPKTSHCCVEDLAIYSSDNTTGCGIYSEQGTGIKCNNGKLAVLEHSNNYYCAGGSIDTESSTASNAGIHNYLCLGGFLNAIASTANNALDDNYLCLGGFLNAIASTASNAGNINYYCHGSNIDVRFSIANNAGTHNYTCNGGIMHTESSTANNASHSNYHCLCGDMNAKFSTANNANYNNYQCTGGFINAEGTHHSGSEYDFYVGTGGIIRMKDTQSGYNSNIPINEPTGYGLISNED